jgi:putative DNA primase/helicase
MSDRTDFNDMAREHGVNAVRSAIESVMDVPPTPPANTPFNDAAAWPDPLPLPSGLPPVMPFDFDLLPEALRPWIADVANRVQCPPDFPAVGAVIALATVVGRKIGIRPKRQDDWLEVPNLWGAIVGRPGVMKSPALRAAMNPLTRLEAIASEGYDELCWIGDAVLRYIR